MPAERTTLSPDEERAFQQWARTNQITDVDHPDAHYDYRGYWRQTQGAAHAPGSEMHFPDTYKTHGHPTFSVESQYSAGPFDGGRWNGDSFVPPGADLLQTSRGSRLPTRMLRDALLATMKGQ
jgi:hypothetical protein